jgi:hypothetical protein
MIIEYCSDGMAVPDHKVEPLILTLVRADNSGWIKVSTENVIHGARAMIATRKINHEQITFRFDGEDLNPDKDGRLASWPIGFAGYVDTWSSQLLDGVS